MGLTATDPGGKNWDPAPPGVHNAICYALVDLGTHENEYQGVVTERHQIWVSFEFPELMIEYEGETKPRVISEFYTLSLHEKSNLRKRLEGWRGREFSDSELQGFDVRNILGKPCLIHVIHNKDGKAKINSIMPADKQAKELKAFNEPVYFSFEDGGEISDNVPDGIKSIIMKSFEYNETGQQNEGYEPSQEPPFHGEDDSIPF